MTNPFTAFAFPATGAPTNQTLPDRISQQQQDVRDFGAVGDGSTDDWDAITAAWNFGQVTTPATATNQVAAFTGEFAYAIALSGSVSGSVLTAASASTGVGTLTLGALTISSYTFDPTSSLVTLTMASPPAFTSGAPLWISGLNANVLNIGTSAALVSGSTVQYSTNLFGYSITPSGGGTLITGGRLAVGQTLTGFTLPISSYTYNSGTGAIVLTMATALTLSASNKITVAGLNIAGLNGTFTATGGSGSTVTYTGPTGQAGSPSAGGTLFPTARITSQASGTTGAAGTYNLDCSFTLSATNIATNGILTATSVTGTINTGNTDFVVSGLACPPIAYFTSVTSQQSGTAGGAGIYIPSAAQNVPSQSMITINGHIVIADTSFAAKGAGYYVKNLNNPTAFQLPNEGGTNASTTGNPTSSTTFAVNSFGLTSIGDSLQFNRSARGTIYFPPGKFFVSKPISFIDLDFPNVTSAWRGETGASIIIGDFADYVFSRIIEATGRAGSIVIERLTILNKNAAGGGIRMGYGQNCRILDCNIIANQGATTTTWDTNLSGSPWGSFETTVENCRFSPGAHVSGSVGYWAFADGTVSNCQFINCETGIAPYGGEGATVFAGCYFEKNTKGIWFGNSPSGQQSSSGSVVSGCHFKNCGTALYGGSGQGLVEGVLIEGTNGQAPNGANPQYGIQLYSGGSGGSTGLYRGVLVTGQYDVAGISIAETDLISAINNTFQGVQAFNSSGSGVPWVLATTSNAADFVNCNVAVVYTMSELPVFSNMSITSADWAGGIATLTTSTSPGGTWENAATWIITVTGVGVGGYNVTGVVGTAVASNQVSYPIVSSLAHSSGGTVSAVGIWANLQAPPIYEGYEFNVNDANTSTWAAIAAGGGSTHAKVRYNGNAEFTIEGI